LRDVMSYAHYYSGDGVISLISVMSLHCDAQSSDDCSLVRCWEHTQITTGFEERVTTRTLKWVEQDVSLCVAEDLSYSTALLRAVQHGTLTGPIVRIYRPQPTVSFGQQDVRLDGYEPARPLGE